MKTVENSAVVSIDFMTDYICDMTIHCPDIAS